MLQATPLTDDTIIVSANAGNMRWSGWQGINEYPNAGPDGGIPPYVDELARRLRYVENMSGLMYLRDILARGPEKDIFFTGQGSAPLLYPGYKPRGLGGADLRAYSAKGALVTNAQALFSGRWDSFISGDFSVPGENNITHTNIHGHVFPLGMGEYLPFLRYHAYDRRWVYGKPTYAVRLQLDDSNTVTGWTTWYENTTIDQPGHFIWELPEFQDASEVGGFIYPVSTSYDKDVVLTYDGWTLKSVEYVLVNVIDRYEWPDVISRKYRIKIDFSFIDVDYDDVWEGPDFWLHYYVRMKSVYTYQLLEASYADRSTGEVHFGQPSYYADAGRLNSYTFEEYTYPAIGHAPADPIELGARVELLLSTGVDFAEDFSAIRALEGYHALNDFRQECDGLLGDLLPGNYVSNALAIENALQHLEANHLETLTDLNSIGELLEPVESLLQLIRALKSGNVVTALKELLDLLTSVKLLVEFGVVPAIEDAREFVERFSVIYAQLERAGLFSPKTFYGVFNWEVPAGETKLPAGSVIVFRSKIRAALRADSLLSNLLPAYAFGIFPSFSQIWDLIPFSFVVDWFANVGGRLDTVDANQVYAPSYSVEYSTHSIKVVSPMSKEALEYARLAATHVDSVIGSVARPVLTQYYRYSMRSLPAAGSSRFDFQPAGGIPDVGTALSLVYQVTTS